MDQLTPGLGSHGWRQRADEDYTLAVSAQVAEPAPAENGSFWDRHMEQAYAEICEVLLVYDLPEDPGLQVEKLQAVFGGFPLFQQEMDEIAMHIGIEMRELRAAGVADYWTEPCFASLCDVLDDFGRHRTPARTRTSYGHFATISGHCGTDSLVEVVADANGCGRDP